MIPRELLTRDDIYGLYERLTKERDAWKNYAGRVQQSNYELQEQLNEAQAYIQELENELKRNGKEEYDLARHGRVHTIRSESGRE